MASSYTLNVSKNISESILSALRPVYSESELLKALDSVKAVEYSERKKGFDKLKVMCSAVGISCELYDDYSLAECRNMILTGAYKNNNISETVIAALFSQYGHYVTPKEYLSNLFFRLEKEDGNTDWGTTASLRMRLLKQAIKYGNCLSISPDGHKYILGGKTLLLSKLGLPKNAGVDDVLNYLDESIFDGYDQRIELLKWVDDIASGKVGKDESTRLDLYRVGILYGMRYYRDQNDNGYNALLDIQKQLFEGFYANNYMRCIEDGEIRTNLVSGYTINYKNFAEAVYLYYLNLDNFPKTIVSEEQKRAYRLKQAENLIYTLSRVNKDQLSEEKQSIEQNLQHSEGNRSKANEHPQASIFFKNLCSNKEGCLFSCSEANLLVYILKHYDIDVKRNKDNVTEGALSVQKEKNTALYYYQVIVENIEQLNISISEYNTGLSFLLSTLLQETDDPTRNDQILRIMNKALSSFTSFESEERKRLCRLEFDNFWDTLCKINSKLTSESTDKIVQLCTSFLKQSGIILSKQELKKLLKDTSLVQSFLTLDKVIEGESTKKDVDNERESAKQAVEKFWKRNVSEFFSASVSADNICREDLINAYSFYYINYDDQKRSLETILIDFQDSIGQYSLNRMLEESGFPRFSFRNFFDLVIAINVYYQLNY